MLDYEFHLYDNSIVEGGLLTKEYIMSYLLKHDADAKCIMLKISEQVTIASIRKFAPLIAQMAVQTGCKRILADLSAASFELSVLDIFSTPDVFNGAKMPRQVKRALVVPASFEDARFLETVNRNKGYNVMVFRDLVSAKKWLFEDDA
jgi:hypothetical protein